MFVFACFPTSPQEHAQRLEVPLLEALLNTHLPESKIHLTIKGKQYTALCNTIQARQETSNSSINRINQHPEKGNEKPQKEDSTTIVYLYEY